MQRSTETLMPLIVSLIAKQHVPFTSFIFSTGHIQRIRRSLYESATKPDELTMDTARSVAVIIWKRTWGAWDGKRMKVHKGTLIIPVLTDTDSGIYICEAKGPHFTIDARTLVEVKG